MLLFQFAILLVQIFLGGMVGHLLVLTFFATRARKVTALPSQEPTHRFLILIPAHNEQKLIGETLENLARLDYPAGLFEVHVVADNCSDATAQKAREKGAIVHERFNPVLRGKGHALQWLINELWEEEVRHDAVVVMDADSLLSPNFLKVVDAKLGLGQKAIQAYYTVRNPGHSATGSLRYAALAAVHYLRPLGRMVLGGSCGLKGNGMVFQADLLKRFEWSGSVTEDIDLHINLILQGEQVAFAPDATVWGEMPDSLANSETQTARWESGRLQMARAHLFRLGRHAWGEIKKGNPRHAFVLVDTALELLIPPFTILVALGFALTLIDVTMWAVSRGWEPRFDVLQPALAEINLLIAIFLMAGLAVYLLEGLKLVNAPRFVYRSLLASPLFVIWKVGQYLKILFGRGQTEWVRTTRNGEQSE